MISFIEWCKQYSIKPSEATPEMREAYREDMIEFKQAISPNLGV